MAEEIRNESVQKEIERRYQHMSEEESLWDMVYELQGLDINVRKVMPSLPKNLKTIPRIAFLRECIEKLRKEAEI